MQLSIYIKVQNAKKKYFGQSRLDITVRWSYFNEVHAIFRKKIKIKTKTNNKTMDKIKLTRIRRRWLEFEDIYNRASHAKKNRKKIHERCVQF